MNRKDRNRRILLICLLYLVLLYWSLTAAIKRGFKVDNYLVVGLILTLMIIATDILYKKVLALRQENEEEEEIRKQLNR